MAALNANDLDKAEALTKARDKFGVEYVKLIDGGWMSNELQVLDAKTLAKKRPMAIL